MIVLHGLILDTLGLEGVTGFVIVVILLILEVLSLLLLLDTLLRVFVCPIFFAFEGYEIILTPS